MTQDYPKPIAPPLELVQQWVDTYFGGKISQSNFHVDLAARAAQWGADQELEACCEWLHEELKLTVLTLDVGLRAARRPKPPSLKEQALEALDHIEFGYATGEFGDTIRRALEALPDD